MITTIRASQLARPMTCAGSLYFKDLHEQQNDEPAKQGTAAGEYLERLNTGQPLPLQARNGVYFDDDMIFEAKAAHESIKSIAQSEIRCETETDWMSRSGILLPGHLDSTYIEDDKLVIDDYKWGWVPVEVFENWQLLSYAIGETLRRGEARDVILKIRQPRPHHEDGSVRSWALTYQELLNYKERIELRCEELAAGENKLQTGPNCKYCNAAAEACPAFNRMYYRAMEITTEFVQDGLTNEEVAQQLKQVQRAQEIIKIKESSMKDLAVSRIKAGQIIPGFVTQTSQSNRSWKGAVNPEMIKAMSGVDITNSTMMTPAQAEKAGLSKKVTKQLTERRQLGMKLVQKDSTELGNEIFGTNNPMKGK